ncbi:hypothetical protein HHI36_016436 [Cryptolaemus montrouzieri]|uniref:Uncharacterized protein n=1 Tax=Cryptolaemus montrouzieri TaxID=559131 RepID=A0ABD2NJN9_9CUCU
MSRSYEEEIKHLQKLYDELMSDEDIDVADLYADYVLIASLSDTVSEHPELLAMKQDIPQSNENIAGQRFLKQILELSPEDKAFLQRTLIPSLDAHKDENERSNQLNHNFQMKEKKMQLPLGLGK